MTQKQLNSSLRIYKKMILTTRKARQEQGATEALEEPTAIL
jgi:hypothetical protein